MYFGALLLGACGIGEFLEAAQLFITSVSIEIHWFSGPPDGTSQLKMLESVAECI
jgi:hypothetical protein